MKIALITDIHHGHNTNYKHLKGEEYVNLFGAEFKDASKKLISIFDQSDLVVNLGDLIHDEDKEQDIHTYGEAVSFFNSNSRVEHVIGNHDLRNLTMKDLIEIVHRDKEYFSFDLKCFHHIVLGGTRKEPRGPHYIEEEQLKWLENDLNTTDLPTFIYCHYPLDNQDLSENYYFKSRPDGGSIANKGFVRPILERSGKVKAVFNGHLHFYHQEVIKGITYCTVPSFSENNGVNRPNHQFALVEVTNEGLNIEIKDLN